MITGVLLCTKPRSCPDFIFNIRPSVKDNEFTIEEMITTMYSTK